MKSETYNLWSFLLQIITAIGAIIFAIWQIKINIWQGKINNRMRKLQDYVAVNIVPSGPGDTRLQILNVGKINLYLQKYRIGENKDSFAKGMLIPSGSNSFLLLPINNYHLNQKMEIELFLIDELGKKFISTGEAVIGEVEVVKETKLQAGQTSCEKIKVPQVSAWSFKTLKRGWEI